MSSLRLMNQIMSEELSVKDKIAFFSKKKSSPVTPEQLRSSSRVGSDKRNSTSSDAIKHSYFGPNASKEESVNNVKQSSQQLVSKTDSELEALKVIDTQADEIGKLKAEVSKYKAFVEAQTCIICMIRLRNILFLPCSHCCVCKECNEKSKITIYECPICKAAVQTRLKVLFP